MDGPRWIIATKRILWDVAAVDVRRPRRVARGEAAMHLGERRELRLRHLAVGHHHEVDVAPLWMEVARRQRSVQVHPNEALIQDGLRLFEKHAQNLVDADWAF